MIRIGGAGEVLLMAAIAGSRQAGVVVICVALRALHARVGAGQRKRRLRVIKGRGHPGRGCMTDFTGLRNSSSRMVRIRGALVILQVASNASRRRQIEVPARVALIALQVGVTTCKRESHRIMVETRGVPCGSGVAFLAGLGNSQRDVIWITGPLEIGHVASHARRGCSLVPAAEVTRRAVEGRVHAGQRKSGVLQVIKLGSQPGVDRVTLFALDWKTGGDVIRRRRLLKRILMARVALDR